MEGIIKDILLANKIARMQKEINALKPADCDALCQTLALAESEFVEASNARAAASEDYDAASEDYETAVADETQAETQLQEVLAGNTECKDGCEPLPAGQACQDECDNEFNVGEAQTNYDEAIQAVNEAQNAMDSAEDVLKAADALVKQTGEAEKAAAQAVEDAECTCPGKKA